MAGLEVEILDVAKADFREAVQWYRDNTSQKTARKFAASFAKALDQIGLFPKGSPVFRGSVRRIGLRGFRHWLYYAEVGGRVQVVAVYHSKTDPSTYSGRIQ